MQFFAKNFTHLFSSTFSTTFAQPYFHIFFCNILHEFLHNFFRNFSTIFLKKLVLFDIYVVIQRRFYIFQHGGVFISQKECKRRSSTYLQNHCVNRLSICCKDLRRVQSWSKKKKNFFSYFWLRWSVGLWKHLPILGILFPGAVKT